MIRIDGEKNLFYQWDLNQRVILTDVAPGTEVHFEGLTVIAYDEGGVIYADVPNIILQSSGLVRVYVWPEETTQAAEFSIVGRPKPSGYVYTETEVNTLGDIEAALDRIIAIQESYIGGGA